MLDRFMDKIMESAASAYLPRLEHIAEQRRTELIEMKSKVRTEPEQVESWFDKEIEKLGNMDIKDLMNKVNATAGI
jgi:HPt (histidine-containing phosphotransfer) domain-containing protein